MVSNKVSGSLKKFLPRNREHDSTTTDSFVQRDYLSAYSEHTDLRSEQGPPNAVRGMWEEITKRALGIFAGTKGAPEADVHIVSYPKSGRTWHRVLLGKYLCEQFSQDDRNMLDTYQLTSQDSPLSAQYTHNGTSLIEGFHYEDNGVADPAIWRQGHVILLVRDLRDLVTSCYFQATKRIDKYEGDISTFIREERFGAIKILAAYNKWSQNIDLAKDHLLLTYEDIHDDPQDALRKTLRFLGLESISEETVERAVDFARFENMQSLEKQEFFNSKVLAPSDAQDSESFKVRKGKIGGYREYLSDSDIAYLDDLEKRIGNPFKNRH